MTGRPTDCTPETTKRIVDAIRLGLNFERAAAAGGISYSTLRDWLRRAEAEQARLADNPKARPRANEQPFLNFSEALSRAQAEGELECARRVYEAGGAGDWRASAWILERRYSQRWGQNAELKEALEALRVLIAERLGNADDTPNP